MSATDYLEGKILDHTLRNAAYAQPSGLYLALHSADPGEAGNLNEVAGGSYVRQIITFSPQVASSAMSSNSQTFANMPAAPYPGLSHFTICESLVGGNRLYWGVLTIVRILQAGDPLVFGVGQIVVNCD